ncbi:MAG TPA: hypothetical protein VFV17_08400 [Usitatibacteraceae bacterium]|nr:hypothetical protein [Usitatibacteraceae bacterium]
MELTLNIPDLLIPAPLHVAFRLPATPALDPLLARADHRCENVGADRDPTFACFGLEPPYPLAALTAAADFVKTAGRDVVFAEPVHFSTGQEAVQLWPSRFLELTPGECAAIAAALNQHFCADGLQFESGSSGALYALFAAGERPATQPVDAARFMPLTEAQPVSCGRIDWRALQNEAQMLLHALPLNDARAAAGKPRVNGLWFWGEGDLPEPVRPDCDTILSNRAPVRQLANATGTALYVPHWAHWPVRAQRIMIDLDWLTPTVIDPEPQEWSHRLQRIDEKWFRPLAAALRRREFDVARIVTDSGTTRHTFTLTPSSLRMRFLRRAKPLHGYAAHA